MTTTYSNISLSTSPFSAHPVEIVERKGIGHPDTICDALAEELSCTLSRFYLDNFGLILHHNVDKALLWGGISLPAFGGGEIIEPMEIFLAGRATSEYNGVTVPVDKLVTESCDNWLRSNFHALDPERNVKLHSMIRPGSSDLVELYLRQQTTGIALANDTSCGVGYAPFSEVESIALQVEKTLNSADYKSAHPETGEDIKVMAIRSNDDIELTISCAFVDRYIVDVDDYMEKKSHLARQAEKTAAAISNRNIRVTINAADNIDAGSLFLTVTGTSGEAGDDGEVGRGNRVNGLITPYRPMNMEAAAGKNPVTHVGKLYNLVAHQIATSLVEELDDVAEASCYLVSRIGSPIKQPMIVDIRVYLPDGGDLESIRKPVDAIVDARLDEIDQIEQKLISGMMTVY